MLTFPPNPGNRARSATRAGGRAWAAGRTQDGFLLIEVLISALMLGLIAIATVTGLQAVNNGDANQRFHNEAVLLAAQSQEELRSDPVSALETLLNNPHTYTQTVSGNTYTITQEIHELSAKEETTNCTVVEHGSYTAPNFRISSKVTWNFLKAGKPVVESSIITPPTSSSLEVDVENESTPPTGVGGVTVQVNYDAFESGTPIKLEGTTNSQGCVFFAGIRATSANVGVLEKNGFVTPTGGLKVTSSEVSIAPSVTTRYQVIYDEGGAIVADFAYQGKTKFEGKNITGDTFVVSNAELGLAPELEVGTAGTFTYEVGGEEHYTANTSTYNIDGITAKGAHYERGDLFPFPSDWAVYAGDCAANDPSTVTKGVVTPGEGIVTPGTSVAIAAPTSYVNLEELLGTEKSPKTSDSEGFPVKITNLSCSAASPAPATPNNAAAVIYVHTQKLAGGALENPFQPFGKFELCVTAFESASENRIDKITYENLATTGAHFKIYPQELTQPGEQKAREAEEAKTPARLNREKEEETFKQRSEEEKTTKTNREKEEAATKKTKETEEKTAKEKRETEEASLREKWKNEEKAGKLTFAARKKLEEEQKAARETDEKTEKTTKETREKNEATTKSTKVKEEEKLQAKREEEEEKGPKATKKTEEKHATEETEKEIAKATVKAEKAAKGEAQKVEAAKGLKC
jgi:Tfp pilus assembly protein PilV